jgi:Helicase associated domain
MKNERNSADNQASSGTDNTLKEAPYRRCRGDHDSKMESPSDTSSRQSPDDTNCRRRRRLDFNSWNERFQELIQFRDQNNHCFVPHSYPPNQQLARWVRKQRNQRKRKDSGLHSSLSDERQEVLTDAGFIWDSHRVSSFVFWNAAAMLDPLFPLMTEHGRTMNTL